MIGNWRQYSVHIIQMVIDDYGTEDLSRLRKKLHDAYPFGERKHHPYKIWREEVKKRLDAMKTLEQRQAEAIKKHGKPTWHGN